MNDYVRVSNELYEKFEKVFKKQEECELIFLDRTENEVSIKSKILKFLNIDGTEYMKFKNGLQVRLDRVLAFNGEDTKYLNHY